VVLKLLNETHNYRVFAPSCKILNSSLAHVNGCIVFTEKNLAIEPQLNM
jgi:hypothetical protein